MPARPFSTALFFAVAVLLFAMGGCATDDDRVVPPGDSGEELAGGELGGPQTQRQTLAAALDTLEALVTTLEEIQDPITAWNHAESVHRLLSALERDRGAYALDMSEDEAAREYPLEIDRLKRLEARRDIELTRIMDDRVIAQVLIEEMNKAEAK